MKEQISKKNIAAKKGAASEYRSRCRKVIKDSLQTAICNLHVLQNNVVDVFPGLSQQEMTGILNDAISEWNEESATWVRRAKIRTKASA